MSLLDIFRVSKIKAENAKLTEQNLRLSAQLIDLGYPSVTKTQQMLSTVTCCLYYSVGSNNSQYN